MGSGCIVKSRKELGQCFEKMWLGAISLKCLWPAEWLIYVIWLVLTKIQSERCVAVLPDVLVAGARRTKNKIE